MNLVNKTKMSESAVSMTRSTLLGGVLALCIACVQPAFAQKGTQQAATTGGTKKPAAEIDPTHPMVPALKVAYQCREELAKVNDYQGIFVKRELINRKLIASKMQIKVREVPFSVYLKFESPYEGREVIYVEGKNGNKLMAHEAGLKSVFGTVSLVPTGPDAMEGNRYPVTMIGLRHMMVQLIDRWEQEAQFGEVEPKWYPNAKYDNVECEAVEVKHPTRRKQFPFHITRLYVNKATKIPFRVENFDFPAAANQQPQIVEEYTYTPLQTNVGLKEIDFETRNPKYQFGK